MAERNLICCRHVFVESVPACNGTGSTESQTRRTSLNSILLALTRARAHRVEFFFLTQGEWNSGRLRINARFCVHYELSRSQVDRGCLSRLKPEARNFH